MQRVGADRISTMRGGGAHAVRRPRCAPPKCRADRSWPARAGAESTIESKRLTLTGLSNFTGHLEVPHVGHQLHAQQHPREGAAKIGAGDTLPHLNGTTTRSGKAALAVFQSR